MLLLITRMGLYEPQKKMQKRIHLNLTEKLQNKFSCPVSVAGIPGIEKEPFRKRRKAFFYQVRYGI
jgi:hypothetical protein